MDNSESMMNCSKNVYALREILKFFDSYMEKYFIHNFKLFLSNDRLGFLRFNNNIEVVFDLNFRNKNTIYLRKSIQDSLLVTPTGETAFYNCIY